MSEIHPVIIQSSKTSVSPIGKGPLKPISEVGKKAQDARMAKFLALDEKVLKSEADQKEYQNLLSDPQWIRANEEALLRRDGTKTLAQEQSERIDHVNFLVKALHWSENPGLGEAIASVERVITEAKPDSSWPDSVRRSWVGDRVELYMALKHRFPERAQQLSDRTQADVKVSQVIAYANGFYDHQNQSRKMGGGK